jgi:hypothetical protein
MRLTSVLGTGLGTVGRLATAGTLPPGGGWLFRAYLRTIDRVEARRLSRGTNSSAPKIRGEAVRGQAIVCVLFALMGARSFYRRIVRRRKGWVRI